MDLWRSIYNQIQELGQQYKDSCFDIDGYRKIKLTNEQQSELLKRIDRLMLQSDAYLDKIKLIPSPPLWDYKHYDTTTHASSADFEYDSRLPDSIVMDYGMAYMSK